MCVSRSDARGRRGGLFGAVLQSWSSTFVTCDRRRMELMCAEASGAVGRICAKYIDSPASGAGSVSGSSSVPVTSMSGSSASGVSVTMATTASASESSVASSTMSSVASMATSMSFSNGTASMSVPAKSSAPPVSSPAVSSGANTMPAGGAGGSAGSSAGSSAASTSVPASTGAASALDASAVMRLVWTVVAFLAAL